MISIIITSYKEPGLKRCIDSIINQKIKENYEILVVDPSKEAEKLTKNYKKLKIKYIKDPSKGKSNALQFGIKRANGNIIISTDGDVFLGENSVNEFLKFFNNPEVGCVSGRPIALNEKNSMLGFWSHLLLDAGAHKIRLEQNKKNDFIECSGYLFAFRNKIIGAFPADVAEDSIVPYLFWKKGYKIKYSHNSKVYVKYPNNLREFIKQRVRTAKAHYKLDYYFKDFPKVKSFKNEAIKGPIWALRYPKTIKEMYWTLLLFPVRLYIWILHYLESYVGKMYSDKWERIHSTKA